jgi:hypothetical protein
MKAMLGSVRIPAITAAVRNSTYPVFGQVVRTAGLVDGFLR